MQDESTLFRYYVRLLLSQWQIILLFTLAAALAVLLLTVARGRMYVAEATITMLRSRTEVEFDPRIRTLSDYELANANISARQDAFVALVTGNQAVQRVLDDVAEHLEPEQRTIRSLRGMVEAETTGDLININVQHEDPDTAALIANSWAEHYVRYVNSVYSSSPLVASNLADQAAAAKQRYDDTQETLEAYTAEEQILRLEREIGSREALLESYRQTLNRIQVSPTDTSQALLLDYYRELQQIENWLVAANSLREQVGLDSDSPAAELGNTVALLVLRSRIFGDAGGSSLTAGIVTNETETGTVSGSNERTSGTDLVLQLNLSNAPEAAVTTGDVDAVIKVLELRRENAQARIDDLVETINSSSVAEQASATESELLTQVSTLESEIAALQSEVEALTARRRELEQARDTAWDTYQVLLGRQREQEIISESPSAEVRIADMAIVPTEPMSRGLIQNTALASLAAVMLSIGAIITWDWWKSGENEFVEPAQDDIPHGSEDADPPVPTGPPSTDTGRAGPLSDTIT